MRLLKALLVSLLFAGSAFAATPTFTSTGTNTATPTGTSTSTITQTNTQTITPTFTFTITQTSTSTRTITRTSTSTPTASSTRTITPSITPSPTAGSVVAYYAGDSTCQLCNYSGSSALYLSRTGGAITNPSLPTPAQGDRSLGTGFASSFSWFKAPTTVISSYGSISLYYYAYPQITQPATETVIEILGSSPGAGTLIFTYNYTSKNFRIYYNGTPGSGAIYTESPVNSINTNAWNKVFVAYNQEGVRIQINDNSFYWNRTPWSFGSINSVLIGGSSKYFPATSTNIIDAVMFSSAVNQGFPPTVSTATRTSTSTPTDTPTRTSTRTSTPTRTITPNWTVTATPTRTSTSTTSPTPTASPTRTTTPTRTSSPTNTPTRTITVTGSPTPIKFAYVGEASPGWKVESYLGNSDLVQSGTVTNPSSPAPAQGSKWLYYSGASTDGLLQLTSTTSILNTDGAFRFNYRLASVPADGEYGLIAMSRDPGSYLNMTGFFLGVSGGVVHIYLRSNYGGCGDVGGFIVPIDTNETVRLQWTGGTQTWFIDGVQVSQNSCVPLTSLAVLSIGGAFNGGGMMTPPAGLYIDDVMYSRDPNDPLNYYNYTPTITQTSVASSTNTPTFTATPTTTATPPMTATPTRVIEPGLNPVRPVLETFYIDSNVLRQDVITGAYKTTILTTLHTVSSIESATCLATQSSAINWVANTIVGYTFFNLLSWLGYQGIPLGSTTMNFSNLGGTNIGVQNMNPNVYDSPSNLTITVSYLTSDN